MRSIKQNWNKTNIFITSGFWPRVRARALRAPVFLSSLPPQTGRCAPPCPSQLRCFSFDPQKYIKSIQLGPPTSKAFFTRNMRSLILLFLYSSSSCSYLLLFKLFVVLQTCVLNTHWANVQN